MIENRKESDFDYIKFFFIYISRKITLQHFLYMSVFITFGIGDAVTAAMMMDMKGIGAEYNVLAQIIYVNYGIIGLIAAKCFFIIIPLVVASKAVRKSYWLINGVLLALVVAGLMAMQANLQKLAGLTHMAPVEINLIYLKSLFIFGLAGIILDTYFPEDIKQKYSVKP